MSDSQNDHTGFDPAELVERAFLLGLGVLDLTREKVTGLASDLTDRGRVSQTEAKRLAERMGAAAGEQRKAFARMISEETNKVLKASGVATKRDLDDLRADIAELKDMIAKEASRTSSS
jgi:polyhydroxyalkanoate synthesis regulator phasin